MKRLNIVSLFLILIGSFAYTQEATPWKVMVDVSPKNQQNFIKGGRLFLHVTKQNEREPRLRSEITFGVTPQHWDANLPFVLDSKDKNVLNIGLDKLKPNASDKYYFQVVNKQNIDDGQENVAGNLYSNIDSVSFSNNIQYNLTLNKIIPPATIVKHEFVKSVEIKSKFLSEFSGKPRFLKASILLPSGYFENPDKTYPICYRAAGLNGRYTAINGLINNKDFTDWWFTKTAPQIIYVFLDSQDPYGDTYQVDSENNGPCGKALTEELIPEIEKQVRYKADSKMRFLTGNLTGGWVSLALQILYPDFFD